MTALETTTMLTTSESETAAVVPAKEAVDAAAPGCKPHTPARDGHPQTVAWLPPLPVIMTWTEAVSA